MNRKSRSNRKTKAKADPLATITRRTFLGAIGLAAAAFIGCEALDTTPIMTTLPDGGDEDGLPHLNHENIHPPVANPVAGADGIIPRTSWAHAGPDLSRLTPLNGVRLITFHHSGDDVPFTATSAPAVAIHLEAIRRFHTDPAKPGGKGGRGWADIAYHFAIDPAGRIWQLRSLKYTGSHVLHHNPNNLGVVVLGNFSLQSMNAAQQARVKSFGALLRKQFQLPIAQVYTHQELGKTDCPGAAMQPFMVSIRANKLI